MRNDSINVLFDTLQILDQGFYTIGGREIPLKLSREAMERATVLLPHELQTLKETAGEAQASSLCRCSYSCENIDSFTSALNMSAQRGPLMAEDQPVLVLNMANPVHPGGGARHGAKAQEEDLCRRSSLLASLEGSQAAPYYEYNRRVGTYMGSDALILTPEVEVFRDEAGNLLEESVIVSVLTCAAPMIRDGLGDMSEAAYKEMIDRRILGMLTAAAHFGYDHLVLGAWGCGAFGNDARLISDAFYRAFRKMDSGIYRDRSHFGRVEFAVLCHSVDQYNLNEFARNFADDRFYRYEKRQAAAEARKTSQALGTEQDRIRGSLFGGAAGDALGYPIEFLKGWELDARYGRKGVTSYIMDTESDAALISDDTQMTLFTANGLLYGDTEGQLLGRRLRPRGYAALAYQDWMRTQSLSFSQAQQQLKDPLEGRICWLADVPELYALRAPGTTCVTELAWQKSHPVPVQDYIRSPHNDSKGCGGVMRVAPLALLYPDADIRLLDYEGAQIAAVTHGHSLGYMPAAVLTHILSRIIWPKEKMTLKAIIKEARDTAADLFAGDPNLKTLTDLIDLAVCLAVNESEDRDNIAQLGEGWVAEETLAIAIYCALRYANDFSAGIIAAVNHGGDSDSTGSVTGNILGAWLGFERIEEKWRNDLELADVILEIADDLWRGSSMRGRSDYEAPDWMRKYARCRWKDA